MDLDQLYQEKILAFARMARSSVMPSGMADDDKSATDHLYTATAKNPVCGDRVTVTLRLDNENRISAIGAEVEGCALCEAGAGYLLSLAPGKKRDDCTTLVQTMESWLKKSHETVIDEDQMAFMPVRDFTSRHTCVCLPFDALRTALS